MCNTGGSDSGTMARPAVTFSAFSRAFNTGIDEARALTKVRKLHEFEDAGTQGGRQVFAGNGGA
jgi:hypothetical protein